MWIRVRGDGPENQTEEMGMGTEKDMSTRVVYLLGSPLRIFYIPPGNDPASEPLLAHAGVILEEGQPATYTLNGLSGPSDKLREFITTVDNGMSPGLLLMIANRLNDPSRYRLRGVPGEEVVEAYCDEIDAVPTIEEMDLENMPGLRDGFPDLGVSDLPEP
jgi:hypothetical protein